MIILAILEFHMGRIFETIMHEKFMKIKSNYNLRLHLFCTNRSLQAVRYVESLMTSKFCAPKDKKKFVFFLSSMTFSLFDYFKSGMTVSSHTSSLSRTHDKDFHEVFQEEVIFNSVLELR